MSKRSHDVQIALTRGNEFVRNVVLPRKGSAMQEFEGRVTREDAIRLEPTPNGGVDVRSDFAVAPPADTDRLHALIHELVVRNRQLEEALQSRIVIEQAKGILAERLRLDTERAFEVLRRAARNNRLKIHDLAARVIAERQTPKEIDEVAR